MASTPSLTRIAAARDRVTERYVRLATPTASGLPNWRVVTWFPALAALGVIVLIVLNISGSSSGVHWFSLGSGSDPRLIFGTPRPIRSDEWLVQQSWVVSQANSGYGEINQTFPGGSDMVLLNELPSWNWSSLFRPHLWGYLLFGLNAGVAWHWWLPALALVSGCYVFVVTILPRRPLVAAFLAVGIYFTPLLQWFYTPSSVFPPAWALLALAGIVWILVDRRLWVRILWAAIIGYLAITMAMGLYVPFILPGIYIVLAFAIGYALRVRPWRDGGWKGFLGRLAPLGVAALAALVVVLVWVFSRASTFQAITDTVYPGQRQLPTGRLLAQDPFLTGIAGAPWEQALKSQSSSILGGNASEGSSVILLALFLLPGLVWILVRSFRKGVRVDWLVLCSLAVLVLFAAYLFVPGWEPLAHLLQLDRIAPERFRIAFVVLLPLYAVLVIDHIDRNPTTRNWRPALLSGLFTTAVMLILYFVIKANDPDVLGMAPTWKITVPLIVAATVFFFFRRTAVLAAAILLIVAVTITINVNPVYRGIYDLSTTAIGTAVEEQDATDDGDWVGIGSYETRAILTQTAVGSFSGVQNYPSDTMWQEIDPTGKYEEYWNRLAHLDWVVGTGEPRVSLPSADVVRITFDPCSAFAQKYVRYVLIDASDLQSTCVSKLDEITQGNQLMRIYEVVPQK